MATTCSNRSQVVISEHELQGHYCFRLQQVGFSEWMASSLAGLMVGFPDSSTDIDESQMHQAIALLENQIATTRMSEKPQRKRRRRLQLAAIPSL